VEEDVFVAANAVDDDYLSWQSSMRVIAASGVVLLQVAATKRLCCQGGCSSCSVPSGSMLRLVAAG